MYEGEGDRYTSLEGMLERMFSLHNKADAIFDNVVDTEDLIRLMTLHFANAVRLSKVLRDKQVLDGPQDDLLSALGPALQILRDEYGMEL